MIITMRNLLAMKLDIKALDNFKELIESIPSLETFLDV
jgi:hypothetical protein